jgi:hypothetical protein
MHIVDAFREEDSGFLALKWTDPMPQFRILHPRVSALFEGYESFDFLFPT